MYLVFDHVTIWIKIEHIIQNIFQNMFIQNDFSVQIYLFYCSDFGSNEGNILEFSLYFYILSS